MNIYYAEDKARQTLGALGSFAGSWVGIKIGASLGASIGSLFGGIGAPVGAIIGAGVGAIAGSIAGYHGTTWLYDWKLTKIDKEEYEVVCTEE